MSCLFCNLSKDSIIVENELAFAIYDKFPVNPGHTLIIPKRHFASLFEATQKEFGAIYDLLQQVKIILDKEFSPDGFNIGVNVGSEAGQTIMHLHVHVIPRYKGDVDKPRGGIRNLKPNLVPYVEEL